MGVWAKVIARWRGRFGDRVVAAAAPDETAPATTPETSTSVLTQTEGVWKVVVLDDPVNLMSYVVLVFKKVFGFDETTARQHMLEVHEQGRSVVWVGLREQAEHYTFVLQHWHLTAILEKDEAR